MYCEIISPDKYRETASCLWIAAFSVNIVLNCYVILRTAMSDYDSIVLWISFSIIFDLLIFGGISFGTTSEKSKFRFIIMFFYILVSIAIMCFLERKKESKINNADLTCG
ncbi:hypothetical protein ACLKA6_015708 [Drosophila palustris]